MLKKVCSLLLIFLISSIFCSCSVLDQKSEKKPKGEAEKIQDMSEEIIRCLTKKDKKAFIELFSEKVRKQENFSGQVDELFSFFECETYLQSDIKTTASGNGSIRDGKRTETYLSPEVPYIQVLVPSDKQEGDLETRYYGLYYGWQMVKDEDSTLEGLHRVTVELLNMDSKVSVGTDEFIS